MSEEDPFTRGPGRVFITEHVDCRMQFIPIGDIIGSPEFDMTPRPDAAMRAVKAHRALVTRHDPAGLGLRRLLSNEHVTRKALGEFE